MIKILFQYSLLIYFLPFSNHLSVSRYCKLLSISRSTCYYKPKGESIENLNLMKKIDDIYLSNPFYGSRQIDAHLSIEGYLASRHKIRRLMKMMDIYAIYQKPNTSKKNIIHKIYPYLLRDKTIDISNDVWCADYKRRIYVFSSNNGLGI